MQTIRTTRRFERDLRTAVKRGKSLDKVWRAVECLEKGEPLAARYRVHRLSGNWSPCWECHIEPDWLLIWHETEVDLVLIATGTHADLFGWTDRHFLIAGYASVAVTERRWRAWPIFQPSGAASNPAAFSTARISSIE